MCFPPVSFVTLVCTWGGLLVGCLRHRWALIYWASAVGTCAFGPRVYYCRSHFLCLGYTNLVISFNYSILISSFPYLVIYTFSFIFSRLLNGQSFSPALIYSYGVSWLTAFSVSPNVSRMTFCWQSLLLPVHRPFLSCLPGDGPFMVTCGSSQMSSVWLPSLPIDNCG